jgi:hypothetical protein
MLKKIYLLIIFFVIIIIIIIGLQFNGYILNNQDIKPPGKEENWQQLDNNTFNFNNSDLLNDSNDYSIFLDITNIIKDIEGIDKITYEIFITNKSIQNVFDYYNSILIEEGYSYNEEYSGITPPDFFELNYFTFVKGLNAVVVFTKTHQNLTWLCYSTGNLLDYQKIVENNFNI